MPNLLFGRRVNDDCPYLRDTILWRAYSIDYIVPIMWMEAYRLYSSRRKKTRRVRRERGVRQQHLREKKKAPRSPGGRRAATTSPVGTHRPGEPNPIPSINELLGLEAGMDSAMEVRAAAAGPGRSGRRSCPRGTRAGGRSAAGAPLNLFDGDVRGSKTTFPFCWGSKSIFFFFST